MTKRRLPLLDEDERHEEDQRVTASLAGLAITLFLLVSSLFIVQKLMWVSALQDCLMAGHRNCIPLDLDRR